MNKIFLIYREAIWRKATSPFIGLHLKPDIEGLNCFFVPSTPPKQHGKIPHITKEKKTGPVGTEARLPGLFRSLGTLGTQADGGDGDPGQRAGAGCSWPFPGPQRASQASASPARRLFHSY